MRIKSKKPTAKSHNKRSVSNEQEELKPMRADPSQGFLGVRRVAKSHNIRSVSNEQEELKPMRADPSQGFGVRAGLP